jgi:NTP pyrophosphatase (non-canonical NTP hydrolase)
LNSTTPITFEEFAEHVDRFTAPHPEPYNLAHFAFGMVGEAGELERELQAYAEWLCSEEGLASDIATPPPLSLLLELGDWIWYQIGFMNAIAELSPPITTLKMMLDEVEERSFGAWRSQSQNEKFLAESAPLKCSLELVEPVKKLVFLCHYEHLPRIIEILGNSLGMALSICRVIGIPVGLVLALNKEKIEERFRG